MTTTAIVSTSLGDIRINLFADQAPKTVRNFTELAEGTKEWTDPRVRSKSTAPLYNGTIFHRVIPGFMIQGGGMTPNLKEKPTRAPIQNEAKNGLRNDTGTIAMARTGDPHSASAQFFINLVNNDGLNYPSPDGWGYAVFGKVVQGFDVVEKIAKVATGNAGPHRNVPTAPVVIESITLLPEKK
jgi:peptidyl-prolyl cis-trans isomerase A (cyclophilin A)